MTPWRNYSQNKNIFHLSTARLKNDVFYDFLLKIDENQNRIAIYLNYNKEYEENVYYALSKIDFHKSSTQKWQLVTSNSKVNQQIQVIQEANEWQLITSSSEISKKVVKIVHEFANFNSWQEDAMLDQLSKFHFHRNRNISDIV